MKPPKEDLEECTTLLKESTYLINIAHIQSNMTVILPQLPAISPVTKSRLVTTYSYVCKSKY